MAAKIADYTGQRFGKLVAVRNTFTKLKNRRTFVWELECDCGNIVKRDISILKQHAKLHKSACDSCNARTVSEIATTHGDTKARLYSIHRGMMRRCYDPSFEGYENYGGKGICVEDFLHKYENFKQYVLSLPDYSDNMTLDRVNPFLGYYRGNLRWATPAQQSRNKGYNKNDGLPTGVSLRTVGKHQHYRVCWTDTDGKKREKSFSVRLLGEEMALFVATEYRELMIDRLNQLGAGYSEYHGKMKEVT